LETIALQIITTTSSQQRNGKVVSLSEEQCQRRRITHLSDIMNYYYCLFYLDLRVMNSEYSHLKPVKTPDPVLFMVNVASLE
jgi:hypothetical protein